LKANIKFMQGKAWIRHDEHYHVDFSFPCKAA
jgi:penicillin-insensitive murein DD-endopeptidase